MLFTDDLSQKSDNIHFDTKGQAEQGRRFATALLDMLGGASSK
jgi:hypothetical protein